MTVEIVLLRHGETLANAGDVWQGNKDSDLSPKGRDQIEQLATRLAGEHFDLVVSSDLGRAVATAQAVPNSAEPDPAWREMSLGKWEGCTTLEIGERYPAELAAFRRGEDIPLGGAERPSEFRARAVDAFERLVQRLSDGDRALVVTHGGVGFAVAAHVLGVDLSARALRMTNTGLTTITLTEWGPQLSVYNDFSHLPGERLRTGGSDAYLVLVRHAQTSANLEERWQGHTEGELTDEGRRQADLLGRGLADVDALYTSPLRRARDTAALAVDGRPIEPIILEDLKEIGFGAWDSLTIDEIRDLDPGTLARLRDGEDVVRGGTGETLGAVRSRVTTAMEKIATSNEGGTIAVVSHGASLHAFVTGLLGMGFEQRFRLGSLANTGVARVVHDGGRFALGAWNLTPHLEG